MTLNPLAMTFTELVDAILILMVVVGFVRAFLPEAHEIARRDFERRLKETTGETPEQFNERLRRYK